MQPAKGWFVPQKNSFCKQKGWVLQPHLQPKRKVLATKRDGSCDQKSWFNKNCPCNQKWWFLQPKRIVFATENNGSYNKKRFVSVTNNTMILAWSLQPKRRSKQQERMVFCNKNCLYKKYFCNSKRFFAEHCFDNTCFLQPEGGLHNHKWCSCNQKTVSATKPCFCNKTGWCLQQKGWFWEW